MKINVESHNLIVVGEKVKSIELLYDELLRNDPIFKPKKPEKMPLIVYHLAGGGKWEFETEVIITGEDLLR